MQLFVIPITTKFLTTENTALDREVELRERAYQLFKKVLGVDDPKTVKALGRLTDARYKLPEKDLFTDLD